MIVICIGVCGSGKTAIGLSLAKELGWCFADADDFHPKENKMKMSAGLPLTDQDRYPWLESIHKYIMSLCQEGKSGVVTCSALKRTYRDILRHGLQVLDKGGSSTYSTKCWLNSDSHCYPTQPSESDSDKRLDENVSRTTEMKHTELDTVSVKHRVSCVLSSETEQDGNKSEGENMMTGSIIDIHFVHLTGQREVIEQRLQDRQGHFMPVALLQSQLDTLQGLQRDEAGVTVDVDNTVQNITMEIIRRLKIEQTQLCF